MVPRGVRLSTRILVTLAKSRKPPAWAKPSITRVALTSGNDPGCSTSPMTLNWRLFYFLNNHRDLGVFDVITKPLSNAGPEE